MASKKQKQINVGQAKLAKMQALAQSLSFDAISTTDGKAREEVRVHAVNPNLRVTISHLDVKEFSDILNRAIDSGDYDRNPTNRSLLASMAKKSALRDEDKIVLAAITKNDPRLQEALSHLPDSGMSRSSTPMEITDAVTSFHVSRNMSISGGTCTIEMFFADGAEQIAVGDKVTIWLEDDTLFTGKITTLEHLSEHDMRFEAVDAMWYLKNNVGWEQPKRMKL